MPILSKFQAVTATGDTVTPSAIAEQLADQNRLELLRHFFPVGGRRFGGTRLGAGGGALRRFRNGQRTHRGESFDIHRNQLITSSACRAHERLRV